MIFSGIGTDGLFIGYCKKMGTVSLHELERRYDNISLIHSTAESPRAKGKIIRDTRLSSDRTCVVLIRDSLKKWKSGLHQELSEVHSLINSENVPTSKGMTNNHARFWKWNDENDLSLLEMSQYENVYFLELKDLSNPKFLEWLSERDDTWKQVKEIPHRNTRVNTEEVWNDYKDKFPVLNLMIKQEQESIDFIREHERYIRL